MKKLMALIALVAMIAVSSIAYADSTVLDVNTSLAGDLVFSNDCTDSLTIAGAGGALVNSELGIPDTCNFVAYSNNSTGSRVNMSGDDMDNTETTPDVWVDIVNASTYTLVAGTEAWGYYLPSTTGHTTGTDGTNTFVNVVPNYFDVSASADTVLSTATPISSTGAFALTVNAASSATTPAGTYDSDMTVDYSDLP